MFIRRTVTRRLASGDAYHSYRLVESRREGARVRQTTLLSLGSHFDLPEAQWGVLCVRLEQLLGQQALLVSPDLPPAVEPLAQALAARLVAAAPAPSPVAEFVEVDVGSLELVQPRSVGVEQVGLHALAQLELEATRPEPKLKAIYDALGLPPLPGGTKKHVAYSPTIPRVVPLGGNAMRNLLLFIGVVSVVLNAG